LDDTTISAALTELASVAASAMTASQRVARAEPILKAHGLTVADLVGACHRKDLPWNVNRATAFGISGDDWQLALHVVSDREPTNVEEVLEALHRAESAAAMLRAGYRPSRDASGTLSWNR
jgi:hypothetical protein